EQTRVSLDFEDVEVGTLAPGAQALGEQGEAKIRVSDEAARRGARSLKFTDAAGLDKSFNPHLVFSPHLRGGVAEGSFSVKAGPGAVFYHEWRDSHSPYRVGPSLWIQDAQLTAQGQVLMEVPVDTWADVAISCGLGSESTGEYSLAVTV